MNPLQKMKVAFAVWKAYKNIGGKKMNVAEILTAISAAEQAIPVIEKAFADLKTVVADVESAITNIKASIEGAKHAATKQP